MLKIGTKIKFLYTPDQGTITAQLGGGIVMVLLEGVNMEIPAFEEDIIEAKPPAPVSISQGYTAPTSKKPLLTESAQSPGVRPKTPAIPEKKVPAVKVFYTGFQLLFEPVRKSDASVDKYKIYLYNDTPFDVLYDFTFSLRGKLQTDKEGSMKTSGLTLVAEMGWDDLNDLPETMTRVQPVYTDSSGEWMEKALKIKAQSFFKNLIPLGTPLKEAHLYILWEELKQAPAQESDLKTYTKSLAKKKQQPEPEKEAHWYDPIANVGEYAAFVNEIDLHIEALHDSPGKLSAGEILQIQMRACDQFLEKAVRLGVPKVYIIHGVGTGRLKDSVAARLRRNTEVLKFTNNWIEKYGWGATEVLLKLPR